MTTAAVVTVVSPVKGMVKDIAVGSSTGACGVHVAGVGREVLVRSERTVLHHVLLDSLHGAKAV